MDLSETAKTYLSLMDSQTSVHGRQGDLNAQRVDDAGSDHSKVSSVRRLLDSFTMKESLNNKQQEDLISLSKEESKGEDLSELLPQDDSNSDIYFGKTQEIQLIQLNERYNNLCKAPPSPEECCYEIGKVLPLIGQASLSGINLASYGAAYGYLQENASHIGINLPKNIIQFEKSKKQYLEQIMKLTKKFEDNLAFYLFAGVRIYSGLFIGLLSHETSDYSIFRDFYQIKEGEDYDSYIKAGITSETISKYNVLPDTSSETEYREKWKSLEKEFKKQLLSNKGKVKKEAVEVREEVVEVREEAVEMKVESGKEKKESRKASLLVSIADPHLPIVPGLWVLTVFSKAPSTFFLMLEGVDSNQKYVVARYELLEDTSNGGFSIIGRKLIEGIEWDAAEAEFTSLKLDVSQTVIKEKESWYIESWSISEEQSRALQKDFEEDSKKKISYNSWSRLVWIIEKLNSLEDKRIKAREIISKINQLDGFKL